VGRRLPWAASERLIDGLLPVIDIKTVDEDIQATAVAAYRRAGSASVSLVDHASFALMRALAIRRAFAFDDDFTREGFDLVT
jgi:predicted nucleic acid-binding protein